MELYRVNNDLTYNPSEYVEKNSFLTKEPEREELPRYEEVKHLLPEPIWDGHEDTLACYDYAWKTGFGNLRKANAETGFVSNFIDTAFNGFLFMWDSSFIVMFGKYASKVFDFQKTLDNFYSHQHKDGFICREICESQAGEHFSRHDPSSTGPNILGWSEWLYFGQTGDKKRLGEVFYPLLAYHLWLKQYHTWRDGSYWSTGWGCGMDNQPRSEVMDTTYHHGFMIWADTCIQQILSGKILVEMAKVLGREEEAGIDEIKAEIAHLTKLVNEKLWCDKDAFYYDLYQNEDFTYVKSIGAYWALLADIVPKGRLKRFVAHLENEKEFKTAHRVPTLSADHPRFDSENGGYWLGAVWAPTNYMVLKGLEQNGYNDLAFEIAQTNVKSVTAVYNETGTLWENYAPTLGKKGDASPNFVGWSGLFPISILFEYVFGIRPDSLNQKIVWYVNLTERHGVSRYPLGDTEVELLCEARSDASEEPVISVKTTSPVTVEVHYGDKVKTILAKP